MKLFITLGNQLFPLKYFSRFKNDHLFFMAEDHGLCTYEKHHKLKILLFLSAMRSHAENLKKNNFKLIYSKIDNSDFKNDYITKVQKVIKKNKIKEISFFEIEDKPFEKKILDFIKTSKNLQKSRFLGIWVDLALKFEIYSKFATRITNLHQTRTDFHQNLTYFRQNH